MNKDERESRCFCSGTKQPRQQWASLCKGVANSNGYSNNKNKPTKVESCCFFFKNKGKILSPIYKTKAITHKTFCATVTMKGPLPSGGRETKQGIKNTLNCKCASNYHFFLFLLSLNSFTCFNENQ